jgi:hypothetical protein
MTETRQSRDRRHGALPPLKPDSGRRSAIATTESALPVGP